MKSKELKRALAFTHYDFNSRLLQYHIWLINFLRIQHFSIFTQFILNLVIIIRHKMNFYSCQHFCQKIDTPYLTQTQKKVMIEIEVLDEFFIDLIFMFDVVLIHNQNKMKMRIDNAAHLHKNKSKQQLLAKHTYAKEGEEGIKRVSAHNNLLIFHPKQYPFNQQTLTQKTCYKTILNKHVTKEQIQKVASLDNPSLLQILKIGKGYQKISAFTQNQLSYSFYYEVVPYSLKKIALLHDYSSPIMAKLLAINLTNILIKLSDYLTNFGIGYCFNLDDIGVTKNGLIKIYVSPLVICGNSKVDRKAVKRSINKIVSWWQITISSNESKSYMPTSVDLTEIDQENTGFTDNEASQLIEDESESEHTVQRQLPKKDLGSIKNSYRLKSSNSSYRVDKMNQIDQQIKQIRSKLIQKVKIYQSNQKPKHYKSISESERFQHMPKQQRNNLNDSQGMVEKMHQNINCINIYTQNNQRVQPISKRMATQPIFSYKISPQRENWKAKEPNYSKMFPGFDYYCESQSVDTYQMQLEYERQQDLCLQKSGSFVERQTSLKNQRQLFKYQSFGSINPKNQVANKYSTGSAGPLQFKTFLNGVLNPQINKKQHNENKQRIFQIITQRNRSSSLVKKNNQQKIVKPQLFQKFTRLSNMSSINQFDRMKSLSKKVKKQEFIPKFNQSITPKQTNKGMQAKMNQLVKVALLKSKNAIALLNRAKKGKSPLKY